MFDYLQKYNNLPKEIRDKGSSPAVLASLEEIEKKYGIGLAATVMRVVIKEIGLKELPIFLVKEFNLDEEKSNKLASELKEKIFFNLDDYLAVKKEKAPILTQKEIFKDLNKEKVRPATASSFYFSPDDEKEIRELSKKINNYADIGLAAEKIEEKLAVIMEKTNINFGSESLGDRYKNILRIYLRGIRDKIGTKATLMKPIQSGGLAFDGDSADEVLKIAAAEMDEGAGFKIEPPKKIHVPEDDLNRAKTKEILKTAGLRDVGYQFAPKPKVEKFINLIGNLDVSHELPPPPPKIAEEKLSAVLFGEPEKQKLEEKKPIIIEVLPKKEENISKPLVDLKASASVAGKIKIEDIKVHSKIMGPIDELRYMNLINFRRLSKDPAAAIQKIKEKINLLDEEYSKLMEGIRSWRASPLNRLYLKMGEESITTGKAINAIIEEKKKTGMEYLTDKEFEAIIELNRGLRF